MMVRLVERCGRSRGERAHRLGLRLHAHQHAPHVGVVDDGDAVAAALTPIARPCTRVLGVVERVLVGALGDRHALHADGEPREVHHGEHVFEAAVLLAHQIADRARPSSP